MKLKEYKIKHYPSNFEIFFYCEDEERLNMHIDIDYCPKTIKSIQEDINNFLNANNWEYTQKLTNKIAKEIKWYL